VSAVDIHGLSPPEKAKAADAIMLWPEPSGFQKKNSDLQKKIQGEFRFGRCEAA